MQCSGAAVDDGVTFQTPCDSFVLWAQGPECKTHYFVVASPQPMGLSSPLGSLARASPFGAQPSSTAATRAVDRALLHPIP